MSGKDQALKDWEKTKQREEYWENLFEKMREKEKERGERDFKSLLKVYGHLMSLSHLEKVEF